MSRSSEQSILPRLAAFVADFRTRDLPQEALHAAARAVVDWTAATIPGGIQPPATLLALALGDESGSGGAALIPSGQRLGARAAALINGSAAHTIEFDDIYRDALYHPGAPTIAAALAIAQDRHASGDLFLRAVIAGYELSTRIGVVVQPTHYNFWHTTGTVGTFGAAAAVATVLGLDAERCAHGLATSGTLAAGLQQAFRSDSMSKPIHAGHAAQTGLMAAIAAEQGVTGTLDILEGPRGFGAAMSNSPDFLRALDNLHAFNIRAMTFKNHSACGHTFAAIDAARELRSRHGLAASGIEAVEGVEIATYAKALEVAGNPDPRTAFEAQFSLPYCVAVALLTGSARLEAFTDERLRDPRVRKLMAKTEQRVDAQADAAYPTRRAARVTLRLRDRGPVSFLAPTRKGDPDNPLSDAELSDKFLELVIPIIGAAPARKLLSVLWDVSALTDLAQLPLPVLAQTPAARRSP
ncbi:MAG: MmgE/PrpD family protein [Gammaproteobacteria bacterium]|nr:MmgE/PrpD family protein [Gammaproteobacteria bacterium]